MYTALLTDDEQAVLDSLTSSISWQQLGVKKLLTASDGVSALELMQTNHVDLLITDIRMPQMDGLELLTKVRSLYPHVHCILLTAYSEFDYAISALKLGVENYLLKPFQQSEMEETIEKALDNLYTQKESSEQLFLHNILIRWVTDTISSEELSERSNLLNINIYQKYYCTVCLRKRNKAFSLSAFGEKCIKLFAGCEIHPFWDDSGRYVMIIGGNELNTELLTRIFLQTAEENQCQQALIISAGTVVNSSEHVAESYQVACKLLETADYSRSATCVLTQESVEILSDDLLIRELNALFQEEDVYRRSEGYTALAVRLSDNGCDFHELLGQLAHSLFQLFLQEFPNKPGIQKQIYNRIHLFSAIPSREDFSSSAIELLEYSYLMYRYYFEQLSPVIQRAIGYIHAHYSDSLSLKEFCAKNKMSTAYLGYLFKKETGMFFNNYLTQYRICCALSLLQTDKLINDIAREVGFASTSYFISCFKKQTGLSPIKYRSIHVDLQE